MANVLHIVVCAGIVPDPLQTLEPITTPAGPGLKNEMVLPAVLDPWAACSLYEAANLAAKNPGSKLWLVSLGPKAKLQQVMMTIAQKVAFELVPIDGPIGGFPDAHSTAAVLAEAIEAIPGLDHTKCLLFGGWESATRGAGVTLQLVGERLGITDQFQGVDQIDLRDDGSFEVLGIAAAMHGDPPALLFDEPFNGMDPEGIVWIRGYLRSLAAQGRAVAGLEPPDERTARRRRPPGGGGPRAGHRRHERGGA